MNEGYDSIRLTALKLVKEADYIWARNKFKTPGKMNQILQSEFLPQYTRAMVILSTHAKSKSVDNEERRAVLVQRAGYMVDVGLAMLRVILGYRDKYKIQGKLNVKERELILNLRTQALACMRASLEYLPDPGTYFNIGSLEEMADNSNMALEALYEALARSRGTDFEDLVQESIQAVSTGQLELFPK